MGFPWFQPGYTQHEVLPVLQLASLGSVTLVTLWLLLLNGAWAETWRRRRASSLAVALLLLALPLGWGANELRGRQTPSGPLVALVQGNIPGEIKWSGNHTDEIFRTFFSLCDSVGRLSRPRLFVWPETATGSYVRRTPEQSVAVAQLAARLGAPVYLGFAHYTWGSDGKPLPWNAAGGWNPDGSLSQFYAKRHLVPFGERMPFENLVPALAEVDLGRAEWQAGAGTVLRGMPGARQRTRPSRYSSFSWFAMMSLRFASAAAVNGIVPSAGSTPAGRTMAPSGNLGRSLRLNANSALARFGPRFAIGTRGVSILRGSGMAR